MSTRNRRLSRHATGASVAAALILGFAATAIGAADVLKPTAPKLGTALSDAELAPWQKHVFPDGTGLPDGEGNATQGGALYAQLCAQCHGGKGEGATAEELVGPPEPPTAAAPNKTIGAYWPHATTLFDFIRRSKPPMAPQSLSNDDVYALVAFLLHANGVIAEDATMNATTLPKVQMPNRDGFMSIDVNTP